MFLVKFILFFENWKKMCLLCVLKKRCSLNPCPLRFQKIDPKFVLRNYLESKIKVQKIGFSQFAFLCLNFIYETVLQFPYLPTWFHTLCSCLSHRGSCLLLLLLSTLSPFSCRDFIWSPRSRIYLLSWTTSENCK